MSVLPPLTSIQARRWAIFAAARPVFERIGYRESTVAELAWAAGLRPASLYHHFPSKASFALFPLSERSGLCATWHGHVVDLPDDPEVRLDALLDFVVDHLESVGLAFRLAQEMSGDSSLAAIADSTIREARRDFKSIGDTLVRNLSPERSEDLFQAIATLAVGLAPGIDRSPQRTRRQLGDLARGWLSSVRSDVSGGSSSAGTRPGSREAARPAPARTRSVSRPS